MRTPQRSLRTASVSVSVSVATILALGSLAGCKQVEEMMGKKDEESSESKEEETKEEAKEEAKEETKEEVTDPAKVDPEPIPEEAVEEVPVEPLAGLDLMLQMIPEDEDGYLIVRDASVVADYVNEATRFADGPMTKFGSSPATASMPEFSEIQAGFAMVQPKVAEVQKALDDSGIKLKEGMAIVKTKSGGPVIVFNAEKPDAIASLVTALGGTPDADLKCKAIEGAQGFNVCTENDAQLEAYKLREDPSALKTTITEGLPNTTIDDANLLGHFHDDGDFYMAVNTIPGQVHMVVSAVEPSQEIKEMQEAIKPTEAKTLAHVDPGSGFVWVSVGDQAMTMAKAMGGGPPVASDFMSSLNGEFLLAGSVDPGGLLLTVGMDDVSKWEPLHALAISEQKKATDEINKMIKDKAGGLGGAKFAFDEKTLAGAGGETKALHMALTDLPEGDILRAYTGVHLDMWAFAANDGFTLAFGPDEAGVSKLTAEAASGPSPELLASLPEALGAGLGRNEVSFIAHVPVDFLHGKHMHELVKSAAAAIPDVEPDVVFAGLGLLAPLSSGTLWVEQPAGKSPVFHFAVRGVGNTETEEGKLALEAAHLVADGGDPEEAFKNLASHYASSPMAYAYKARAGTDGPGYLVGSGVGAVMAAGAVAMPLVMGKRNEKLAEDLGVKAEDPVPEVKPVEVPKPVKTKKVPKKKEEPKSTPKKEDPVVEPKRPLPPKPEEPTDNPRAGRAGERRRANAGNK